MCVSEPVAAAVSHFMVHACGCSNSRVMLIVFYFFTGIASVFCETLAVFAVPNKDFKLAFCITFILLHGGVNVMITEL
jgi:hypothetical protein